MLVCFILLLTSCTGFKNTISNLAQQNFKTVARNIYYLSPKSENLGKNFNGKTILARPTGKLVT